MRSLLPMIGSVFGIVRPLQLGIADSLFYHAEIGRNGECDINSLQHCQFETSSTSLFRNSKSIPIIQESFIGFGHPGRCVTSIDHCLRSCLSGFI